MARKVGQIVRRGARTRLVTCVSPPLIRSSARGGSAIYAALCPGISITFGERSAANRTSARIA
jgi:hypothetical protein